ADGRQGRDQLRPPFELEPGRDERLACELFRVRLPEVDLGARTREPAREILLQRGLVAGRISDLAGRRVPVDQVGGERDELVTPLLDFGHDAVLALAEVHGPRTLTRTSSCHSVRLTTRRPR